MGSVVKEKEGEMQEEEVKHEAHSRAYREEEEKKYRPRRSSRKKDVGSKRRDSSKVTSREMRKRRPT